MYPTHECCNWFWLLDPAVVVLDPLCSILFCASTDLTDEDDTFRLWVLLEDFQGIDQIRACDDVSAHTNAQTLPKTGASDGGYSLIRKCTRLSSDTYMTRSKGRQRLEPDTTVAYGSDYTRCIRTYKS